MLHRPGGIDGPDFNQSGAFSQYAQSAGGGIGQVDETVFMEWTPVIDLDDNRLAIRRLVTRAYVGSGSVLCAADILYIS